MQKEDWIKEVFESTKGIKRAEASPFLFEKIANRIESNKQLSVVVAKPVLKWALAACTLILISVNLFSVIKTSSGTETKNTETILVSEYNHSIIYNY